MTTFASRSRLRQRATSALIAFVAATLVAMLSPVLRAQTLELVCSAQGAKFVPSGDAGHGSGSAPADHTAHCPLCMPVGAPPAEIVRVFTPVPVHAPARLVTAPVRIASLVGAPLPARGPPSVS